MKEKIIKDITLKRSSTGWERNIPGKKNQYGYIFQKNTSISHGQKTEHIGFLII